MRHHEACPAAARRRPASTRGGPRAFLDEVDDLLERRPGGEDAVHAQRLERQEVRLRIVIFRRDPLQDRGSPRLRGSDPGYRCSLRSR